MFIYSRQILLDFFLRVAQFSKHIEGRVMLKSCFRVHMLQLFFSPEDGNISQAIQTKWTLGHIAVKSGLTLNLSFHFGDLLGVFFNPASVFKRY